MKTNFAQKTFWLTKSIFWRTIRKTGLIQRTETETDQGKDFIAPFDEFPPCEKCGGQQNIEVLTAKDGSRIVECSNCKLWFTSPRISEKTWTKYLQTFSERSKEFTDNRLRYGVPLNSLVKYSHPFWRKRIDKTNRNLLMALEDHFSGKIQRIHDVGCGVGFLVEEATKMGLTASGNELNSYACKIMNEELGLNVHNATLAELQVPKNSLDAVTMIDYLEHTYHPLRDLKTAFSLLREGGLLFVKTFHIKCQEFDQKKENWNYLFWNHVYHFSPETLIDMIKDAGFEIEYSKYTYDEIMIDVIAKK